MTDLRAMMADQAALDARLRELRRERRRAEDCLRRPPGARNRRAQTTAAAALAVAAAGARAGPAAAALLLGRGWAARRRAAPEAVPPDAAALEATGAAARAPPRVAAAPDGGVAAREVEPAEAPAGARRQASKFLEELALHEWVKNLNQGAGVAPSCGQVWARRQQERRRGAEAAAGHDGAEAMHPRYRRQWVRRWRRRWRVGRRQLPSGPGLARAALESKAGGNPFWGGPRTRPQGEPAGKKGGRIPGPPLVCRDSVGPVLGPFSGPRFGRPGGVLGVPTRPARPSRRFSGTTSWSRAAHQGAPS